MRSFWFVVFVIAVTAVAPLVPYVIVCLLFGAWCPALYWALWATALIGLVYFLAKNKSRPDEELDYILMIEEASE